MLVKILPLQEHEIQQQCFKFMGVCASSGFRVQASGFTFWDSGR